MTIDGNTILTPQGLKEYYDYARNDNFSLNHTMQRNQLGKKKVAEMTWTNLFPDELAAILAWADDLNSHVYGNTDSSRGFLTFTGLCTITDDGQYQKGGSYMIDTFSVRIREV